MLLQAVGKQIGITAERGIIRQSIFSQSVKEGAVSLLIDIRAQRTAEIADFPVALLFQIGNRQIHSFAVIYPDVCSIGIDFYIVIQQYRRSLAAAKLMQPLIGQGHSQKQSPYIVASEHIFIIGIVFLQMIRQLFDGDNISGRFCHFSKAHDNIVTEIVGALILHIFDENTQLFCAPFPGRTGISQLYRRFQNGFSQCFAYVGSTVQRLGNCTF